MCFTEGWCVHRLIFIATRMSRWRRRRKRRRLMTIIMCTNGYIPVTRGWSSGGGTCGYSHLPSFKLISYVMFAGPQVCSWECLCQSQPLKPYVQDQLTLTEPNTWTALLAIFENMLLWFCLFHLFEVPSMRWRVAIRPNIFRTHWSDLPPLAWFLDQLLDTQIAFNAYLWQ